MNIQTMQVHARGSISPHYEPPTATRPQRALTIIVPAYNEAASIADTVASLRQQSLPPVRILVVDDCSSDGTGDIARAAGATVLRPPQNTGSKAGAQTFALTLVDTEFVMAIDADTILAPDAIEKIFVAMEDDTVVAACGFVLPRHCSTLWERGRYLEYMLAFTFYKPIQDFYARPMISSGCFSIYRTDVLRQAGGWSTRTMAEDMDLTWTFYEMGKGVRFVADALCYPIEPHTFDFMSKQLRRWSHGFLQNVRLHWRGLLGDRFLSLAIAVALWDAVIASLAYILLLPVLVVFVNPLFLIGYIVDLPVVAVPALVQGYRRGEIGKVLAAMPAFFVLRIVNSIFLLKAVWDEFIVGRSLTVYEKGH